MDGNRTRTARPIRVIQFGEGNFLRAFVDYMLDVANERGAFDGHVAIVKPTNHGNLDKFARQDNFYTVLTRGRANGQVVDERRLIGCVERCLSPYDDPDGFLSLAELPVVRFVVFGIDPLWVFRQEDYEMFAHWEHLMDGPEAPAADAPAGP